MFTPPTEPISSAQSAAPDPVASRLEYENPKFPSPVQRGGSARRTPSQSTARTTRPATTGTKPVATFSHQRATGAAEAQSPSSTRRSAEACYTVRSRRHCIHPSVGCGQADNFVRTRSRSTRSQGLVSWRSSSVTSAAVTSRILRICGRCSGYRTQPIACCLSLGGVRSCGLGPRSGSGRQSSSPERRAGGCLHTNPLEFEHAVAGHRWGGVYRREFRA
jgi:hypothetical protein